MKTFINFLITVCRCIVLFCSFHFLYCATKDSTELDLSIKQVRRLYVILAITQICLAVSYPYC